uniref:TPR_REGION domain-containing protein n=1 Tax=Dracunculus medinensis TaxID=318479 RepID=A0A0N4U6F1_DRAME
LFEFRWTDRGTYKRHAITNKDDHRYREQLDKADYLVEKHKYREAFEIFEEILNRNPDSPRAHFGRARAFDIRGEMESNKFYLDLAINEYQEVLDIDDTPDALFRQAAYRLIDRARFRNSLHKALQAQRSLIDRYPDDLQLQNDFALTFLMMNRNEDALKVFQNVLKIQPNNAVAQAYYGYIIKLNGDLENGVLHMRKGLKAARHLIADPKFYYHFGDALTKLGRKKDAFEVYSIGAKVGLFLSPYQRSLYNYDGLTARPWWSIDQTTYAKYLKHIERQWTIIREEAVRLLESNPESFIAENKELTIGGTWSAYYIYRVGSWERENCLKIPKTCELVRRFKEESNATKNEMKISLLTSGTRVWPYCGYSNSRLRAQLGLVVPSDARIRVADETRGWKTGKFIVFDDSFEHELWFVGASQKKYRLILEIDLWHPEIEPSRRITLDGF